ncbi:B3 domain-containing protein_Os12g40080 isoform X4 [Triticum aestivum]|uniref:B3 domain-containing protein_Os12g40080 isoform X4 n=1 Tax=Triticum aestivum TaxID=4565 RepID=UPI001ABC5D20|nr:B3 domain-containing protein LOC_Os12g40080-like isoform X4 [Triticum aestivum]
MAPDQDYDQDNSHVDDTQKYFFKCMVGDFPEKMAIPQKFVDNFNGHISEVIKLEAPDGNIYNIQAIRDLNKIVLGSGWGVFVSFYKLKAGYFLVFRETRRRDCGSHDNNSRKTKKMTPVDSPSPRSAEGVTSPEVTMNSAGLREITEPHYVLATGCNLTTAQKAEVDALVKKVRPVIPFYITAMNKTSMSGSLVICKDYAAKYLPHEEQFITLCHPHKSNIWVDNLKVITDGSCMLSVGWSCFVLHNELRESDICLFEVSKNDGEVTMVVHSLEGGHHLQGKEPESQNKCSYPVKVEVTEEEESDKEHAESSYYYSRYAYDLTGEEQEEIFRSALIQQGNPVYVAVLQENHVSSRNNLLTFPREFAAKHLAERSHDILLLRPNRREKWCVRYYYHSMMRIQGFSYRSWTKFVSDNGLQEGHVCVFELMKGVCEATMMVHVFRKFNGRFVLLD